MGLDMYLSATKYNPGGWNHYRSDYVRDEAAGTVTLVPKSPKPKEARAFDTILRALGFGTYEKWSAKYPEGNAIDISITVAYWRKANAIHHWFVMNTQDGVDECQKTEVSREQLAELRDICQIVLGTTVKGEPTTATDFLGHEYESFPNATLDVEVATAALGTQAGFFFGSTDYDEWYINDLELTVTQITTILDDPALKDWSFEYQSSW